MGSCKVTVENHPVFVLVTENWRGNIISCINSQISYININGGVEGTFSKALLPLFCSVLSKIHVGSTTGNNAIYLPGRTNAECEMNVSVLFIYM